MNNQTAQNSITSRAMLVSLNIRSWSARKHDATISREVAQTHNTTIDAGRYNKSLIAREAIAEIKTLESAARKDHYRFTLPWSNEGDRILPAKAFPDYSAAMRSHKALFDQAVNKFIADYPALKLEAELHLNGLFKESDYPIAGNDISQRFGFETNVSPLPTSEDFRVELSTAESEAIRQEIDQRSRDAVDQGMRDVFDRIRKVVLHAAEKLESFQEVNGKRSGTFKNTLIENIRELVDVLPLLNIKEDPALDELTKEIADKLTAHDAETLRESPETRKDVATSARAILDKMEGFTG